MTQIIIGRDYPKVVTKLIQDSQQSIKILMYAWMWYPKEHGAKIQLFNNALLQAAARGVKVSALVNGDYICNQLKDLGIDIKKSNTGKLMHAKIIIVDEKYLVLGSHNLTKNGFELNHEISVLIDEPEDVKACSDFFNTMFF